MFSTFRFQFCVNRSIIITECIPLLGASAKQLRKSTLTFALSFSPSARLCMEIMNSHRTGFCEIYCWKLLLTFVAKFEFRLKSERNNRHFTRRPVYIYENDTLPFVRSRHVW